MGVGVVNISTLASWKTDGLIFPLNTANGKRNRAEQQSSADSRKQRHLSLLLLLLFWCCCLAIIGQWMRHLAWNDDHHEFSFFTLSLLLLLLLFCFCLICVLMCQKHLSINLNTKKCSILCGWAAKCACKKEIYLNRVQQEKKGTWGRERGCADWVCENFGNDRKLQSISINVCQLPKNYSLLK